MILFSSVSLVPFTASITKLNHYHYKLNVQGTSQVVKLPRKWKNFSKITNSFLEFFFFVKDFVIDCRTHHLSQNPQKSYLWQCNKPYNLKPSRKSSFSKTEVKHSLLGKLLIDYILSIAPSTSNIIVRVLNVSNRSTSAGSNSIQAETKYYLLKYLLTQ